MCAYVNIRLALSSCLFVVAVSVITLECDSLQQLCPSDDQPTEPRMCVCNVTGSSLVWGTSLTSGAVAIYSTTAPVGTTATVNGFTANLVLVNPTGLIVSTLTFNPSAIRSMHTGLSEFIVSCEDVVSTDMEMANVTITSVPGVRQFVPPLLHNASCDTNTSYKIPLQWNDNVTGGPDVSILYYLVEVTSPSGFVCPPEQCNVTANTTTITGLSCSTDYSFTVRAVNCIGTSDVSITRTVTAPTPSKF